MEHNDATRSEEQAINNYKEDDGSAKGVSQEGVGITDEDGAGSVEDMSTSILGQESAGELAALASQDEDDDLETMQEQGLTSEGGKKMGRSEGHEGQQGKAWCAIRDICAESWHFNEQTGKWSQGPETAPEFWKNYEYSPLLVETALGLYELSPKAPIVPEIPFIDRVNKAKKFIEAESELFMVVNDGRVYDEHGEETSSFGNKVEQMGLSPVPISGINKNYHDSPSGKYNVYDTFHQKLGRSLSYNSVAKSTSFSELQSRQMHMCRDILAWTERDKELKRALIADLRARGGRTNASIPPVGGISLEARSIAQSSLQYDRSLLQSSSEVLIIDTEAGTEEKYEFNNMYSEQDDIDASETFTTQKFGQTISDEEAFRPARSSPNPKPAGATTAQLHSSLNTGDHHKRSQRTNLVYHVSKNSGSLQYITETGG